MTRATSAETYRDLETRGVLKGQRLEVLRAFERFGPGTSAEVLGKAALAGNLNLARARVTELANSGLISEIDERPCSVTKRRAIVWEAVVTEPRVRPVRVDLSVDDIDAIAKFCSGERGQFCPNLDKVHRKILDTYERQQPTKTEEPA